jgi:hypothetical protein
MINESRQRLLGKAQSVRVLQVLTAWQRDALLAQQHAQALLEDVLDHPRRRGSRRAFDRVHVENGSPSSAGQPSAAILICARRLGPCRC